MEKDWRCLLIGNSRWHWALKHKNQWQFIHTTPDNKTLRQLRGARLRWAAVGPVPSHNSLKEKFRIDICNVPPINLPPWLGIDRALGAWGAFQQAKISQTHAKGLLVADAGTVLSLTKVNAHGEFTGGQLVGGLGLQIAAMVNGAEKLTNPQLQTIPKQQFPTSTPEAMMRGSFQALIGTILEAQRAAEMPIWLCGGDSPLLFEALKARGSDVVHHPNLVLEGMVDIHNQINQCQDHSESDPPFCQL